MPPLTKGHIALFLATSPWITLTQSFQITSSPPRSIDPHRYSSWSSTSSLHMGNNRIADFEYQEMRVQLDAMKSQGIPSRDLAVNTRTEMEQYVRQVATLRPSPVALKDIGQVLPGTKWRLGFSTAAATLGDLPRDAGVYLDFKDDEKSMDYILEFSEKTLGLNRLVAKSKYTFDSGEVNPGLLTFVYDEITTDVFGFKGLGVGFFGLLKGRANFVESSYFDGRFWIERGFSPEGVEYFNVYTREET